MCVRLVRFWYEYGEIGESMTMAWWLPLPRRTPALLQLAARRHSRRMGWQTPDHCGRTHNITESVLQSFRDTQDRDCELLNILMQEESRDP